MSTGRTNRGDALYELFRLIGGALKGSRFSFAVFILRLWS